MGPFLLPFSLAYSWNTRLRRSELIFFARSHFDSEERADIPELLSQFPLEWRRSCFLEFERVFQEIELNWRSKSSPCAQECTRVGTGICCSTTDWTCSQRYVLVEHGGTWRTCPWFHVHGILPVPVFVSTISSIRSGEKSPFDLLDVCGKIDQMCSRFDSTSAKYRNFDAQEAKTYMTMHSFDPIRVRHMQEQMKSVLSPSFEYSLDPKAPRIMVYRRTPWTDSEKENPETRSHARAELFGALYSMAQVLELQGYQLCLNMDAFVAYHPSEVIQADPIQARHSQHPWGYIQVDPVAYLMLHSNPNEWIHSFSENCGYCIAT